MRHAHNPNKRRKAAKFKPANNNFCKGPHTGPWTFVTNEKGTKRTCACGFSVTEIGREVIITPVGKLYTSGKKKLTGNKPRLRA
jgi:hypothetical protein